MKKLYLLALAVLAEQPAPANEHTPSATDQRTEVLGQSETEAPNPAPGEKTKKDAKKDAQALFEESLRQRYRRARNKFRNTRERRNDLISESAPCCRFARAEHAHGERVP